MNNTIDMKVTLKSGIFVGSFLNVHGNKVMISTFLLTDVVDYFSLILLESSSTLPENESESRVDFNVNFISIMFFMLYSNKFVIFLLIDDSQLFNKT